MIVKTLQFAELGASKRYYNIWNQQGTLSYQGVEYQGVDSDIAIFSTGQIAYSLQETGRSVSVQIITDNATFIDDLGYGSALSECTLALLHYSGSWQSVPVSFRGTIGQVVRDGAAISFSIDSGSVDSDRIYPKIWSQQSQLSEYPNDQGFRFLPLLIKKPLRQFLVPISSRV